MERVVIAGGGYGGSLAAARIAQHGVPVTLIDAGDGLVERIRLHQVAAGDDIPPIPYSRLSRLLNMRSLSTQRFVNVWPMPVT